MLSSLSSQVANWPFFSHAFLTNYLQKKCSDTLEAAAAEAFDGFDANLLAPESMKAKRKSRQSQKLQGYMATTPDKFSTCVPCTSVGFLDFAFSSFHFILFLGSFALPKQALQDLSFKKADKICLPGCLPTDWHSMNTLLGTTCHLV